MQKVALKLEIRSTLSHMHNALVLANGFTAPRELPYSYRTAIIT